MEQKGRFVRRTEVRCPAYRYLMLLLALLLAATLTTGMVVWAAADSELDPLFDADGIVTTNFSEFDQINDIAIQPDGKIVAAGHTGTFRGTTQNVNMMVARYNIDGSLDSTFGGDGIEIATFFVTSKAMAVALQPDGKIVVAGWATGFLRRPFFAVVRYNTNGSLDDTFGGGIIVTSIGSSAQIMDLAIQADGKIVVAGDALVPGSTVVRSLTLARYNSNGPLDTTFGNNGLIQTIPQTGVPLPIASGGIAIQMDQKIVVGGVCLVGSVNELCVSRYNSNGSRDTTFDLDGLAVTDFDTFSGGAQDLVIQPDGKIVAAGFSVAGASSIPALARYNDNGSLDPTFGLNGKVTTLNHQFDADAVALQADGKIVIVGEGFDLDQFTHSVITVARYHPEGFLDESFGNAGIVMTPIGTTHAAATAVAIQADGRILAGGFGNFTTVLDVKFSDFALVRYGGPPNTPPVVTITDPSSGSVFAVNTPIHFAGTFTDDEGDTHTAEWTFESITKPAEVFEPFGSTPGVAQTTHTFTEAGVYKVSLKVTDNELLSDTATTVHGLEALVVIYDPNGGFIAGGGWIDSPPGAFALIPTLTGKANFGFVSKYQSGAGVPTGNTKFHFTAGDLDFKSTSYEWLIVSGGRKAQYKGVGTINGSGAYRFMLTCIDGDKPGGDGQDKFRIRIWSDTDGLVYDNQLNASDNDDPTTVLGGGSIVIHN